MDVRSRPILKVDGWAEWPLCSRELFPANQQGPAEYCPEDSEPGSDWCLAHDPDRGEPDWDDRRKDALYECYD